jgi:hypothetical protein
MASSRRFLPQTLLALIVGGIAVVGLTLAWLPWWRGVAQPMLLQDLIVVSVLGCAALVAEAFPIHVYYHTKLSLTTIPLFLMACLLPPPLAATAAGLTILFSEILGRAKLGNDVMTMLASASRWVIIALVGAYIAQIPAAEPLHTFWLAVAAVVMFVCDVVLGSLEVAAFSDEPPLPLIGVIGRESAPLEATQYVLGILGVWIVDDHPWRLLALLVPAVIVYHAFKNAKEMRDSTRRLLEGMADAVDLRDMYTGGHSRRVTEYTRQILRELESEGNDADLIVTAARVHDIGKIGIPDSILRKPAQLTPEEWAVMASHPEQGANLLARYPDFALGVAIVRHHHERWDGAGYPDGLVGHAIPFGARVIAVADSFDAMTSDRPYRRGLSTDVAVRVLRDDNGRQWDPAIVTAFLRGLEPASVAQPSAAPGLPA